MTDAAWLVVVDVSKAGSVRELGQCDVVEMWASDIMQVRIVGLGHKLLKLRARM